MKDKLLVCFLLCCTLALVLGFYSIHGALALSVVAKGGYWFVLTAFSLWIYSLRSLMKERVKELASGAKDWWLLSGLLACGITLLIHETFGFKILMDEVLLLSTSMSMHFDRLAVNANRGNDINGVFVLLDGLLDKRPLFHPFCVSLVHDFTGYRPENIFYLNGFLTFVFLWQVSWVGRLLAGRTGAFLGILLFAGLPLLSQNCTGGGFELLNLCMALALYQACFYWIKKRDADSLAILSYSAILLVQVRYESVLLALPAVLSILWVWWKEKRLPLDWRLCIAPLLLVPYALHLQIFTLSPDKWQMVGKPGLGSPFAFGYISQNLAHALNFYFSWPSEQPNSLLFSALGWLLMPFAGLLLYRYLRGLSMQTPQIVSAAFFFIGLGAHFILMMSYFWGQFDEPIIRRLSLPSHLMLLMAILLVFPSLLKSIKAGTAVCVAAGVFIIAVSIPAMANHTYSQMYWPARETAWRIAFIKQFPLRDFLMIDNDAYIWLTQKVSATPTVGAKTRTEAIQYHLRNKTFAGVYVFQHVIVAETSGETKIREDDDLGEAFELTPIMEARFTANHISRISRVTGVRHNGVLQEAGQPRVTAQPLRDPEQVDRIRREYLENFVRRLP